MSRATLEKSMRSALRSGRRDRVDLYPSPQSVEADRQVTGSADLKRRGFLLSLGLGGAGAVAAAAAAIGAAAAAEPAQAGPSDGTEDGGYQVTEHVRNYYRTTRL